MYVNRYLLSDEWQDGEVNNAFTFFILTMNQGTVLNSLYILTP